MKLYNSPKADLVKVETNDICSFSWLDGEGVLKEHDLSSYFTGITAENGDME